MTWFTFVAYHKLSLRMDGGGRGFLYSGLSSPIPLHESPLSLCSLAERDWTGPGLRTKEQLQEIDCFPSPWLSALSF